MEDLLPVRVEFAQKGPSYTLTSGEKTLSVMASIVVLDQDGKAVQRQRSWAQFVVRGELLILMAGDWVMDPDTVETLEMTPQGRIEKAFKEAFKSLKISAAE